MRKRVVAGLLALSLACIPVGASAMSYRGNGYICKAFKTTGGTVTGSVTYTKNTGLLKDTVKCTGRTTGNIVVKAKCCYHETVYREFTLVGDDHFSAKDATKNISSTYCYGKLSLSGDTKNTLYADE